MATYAAELGSREHEEEGQNLDGVHVSCLRKAEILQEQLP
jgi:hypothetical protein